ncbi:MAG: hypothetical protein ACFFA0_12295 [Promethearchaeota archaeon]
MEFLLDNNGPMYRMIAVPLSDFVPMNGFKSADDIKGTIVFLESKVGSYISGVKIVVDRGFTINTKILILII